MAMENPRDSFIFYRSFFESLQCFEDDKRLLLYDAIAAKALYGAEPDNLSGHVLGMYKGLVPQIEANQKRYEDGTKGADYGKRGGRPPAAQKQKKPSGVIDYENVKTPVGFLAETPNVNENENVNDNVNITPLPPLQGDVSESKTTLDSGESLELQKATGTTAPPRPAKKSALSAEQRERFEEFWAVWPHKVSRGQAETTWGKLRPDKDLLDKIIAGVERAKKQDRRFLSAEYTPHASTWLNSRGWEDEYTGGGKGGDARDAPSYDLEEFKRQTAYSVPKF